MQKLIEKAPGDITVGIPEHFYIIVTIIFGSHFLRNLELKPSAVRPLTGKYWKMDPHWQWMKAACQQNFISDT